MSVFYQYSIEARAVAAILGISGKPIGAQRLSG